MDPYGVTTQPLEPTGDVRAGDVVRVPEVPGANTEKVVQGGPKKQL